MTKNWADQNFSTMMGLKVTWSEHAFPLLPVGVKFRIKELKSHRSGIEHSEDLQSISVSEVL